MRLAEDQLRRGDDYSACVLAKTNADSAKGTDRLATAMTAQEKICAEHARMTARRREQADAQRALLAQRCEGPPRMSVEEVESLARTLSANPKSQTLWLSITRGGLANARLISLAAVSLSKSGAAIGNSPLSAATEGQVLTAALEWATLQSAV
jgi:hypothetical protein